MLDYNNHVKFDYELSTILEKSTLEKPPLFRNGMDKLKLKFSPR